MKVYKVYESKSWGRYDVYLRQWLLLLLLLLQISLVHGPVQSNLVPHITHEEDQEDEH